MKQTATAIKIAHSQMAKGKQPAKKQTSCAVQAHANGDQNVALSTSGMHSALTYPPVFSLMSGYACLPYTPKTQQPKHCLLRFVSGTFFRPEVYSNYMQLLRAPAENNQLLEDLQVQQWPTLLRCIHHWTLMVHQQNLRPCSRDAAATCMCIKVPT